MARSNFFGFHVVALAVFALGARLWNLAFPAAQRDARPPGYWPSELAVRQPMQARVAAFATRIHERSTSRRNTSLNVGPTSAVLALTG